LPGENDARVRAEVLVAVAPNLYAKGLQPGRETPARSYVVMPLREALERAYRTDAMMVTYVSESASRQPRINKPGLELWPEPLWVQCFVCDVDNPQHAQWTDETFRAARVADLSTPSLATAGVYYTRRGRRIVQPLTRRLRVPDAERHARRWLATLEREGIAVDWQCADWTRHFRLPHTPREPGGRARLVDFERMVAIDAPDAAEALHVATPSSPRPSGTKPPVSIAWTSVLPARWQTVVSTIAPAVRAVPSEWHSLFLALAGALLRRGVPAEHVPAICREISLATGADTRTIDREAAARSSVERHQLGLPTTGFARLRDLWPAVADAVDVALARGSEARLREQASCPPNTTPRPLTETTAALEQTLRAAPDGVSIVVAECGLGKTRAAARIAAERAARTHASSDATGERAPLFSKTSLSVDKHELALQLCEELRRQGVAVKRRFGPLSLRNADGSPACRFHEVAAPLVAGGQRMQWELCERRRANEKCPHYDECPAREGVDGPSDARISVGPHALLGQLDGDAGTTGLLVLDEPPPFLTTEQFAIADLDEALRVGPRAFDSRYAAALAPALLALRGWIAAAALDHALPAEDAVRASLDEVPTEALEQARRFAACPDGDPVECAIAAPFPDKHHGSAPPLVFVHVEIARSSPAYARELGRVSRLLRAVHQALASEYPVVVRVEQRGSERRLLVTAPNETLAKALRRRGSVVVMDANAELHAPVIERIVGYAPPLHRFAAVDGAPVSRTLIRTRQATRTAWFEKGRLKATGLVSSVRALLAWAEEDPGTRLVGVITMYVVETALRATLGEQDALKQWTALGQPAADLAELVDRLGPLLRGWPGELRFAHYGATRGLNRLADVDALATLGDPWMNLGDVRNDTAFLQLGESWQERYEAWCRAELEQAHGRLRAVHRTRPGRALHVGAVLPGGSGWASGQVEIRKLEGGRPTTMAAMTADDLRKRIQGLGTQRQVAGLLGVSTATLERYLAGRCAIPAAIAERLRSLKVEGLHH
jgi:hypothetical protein